MNNDLDNKFNFTRVEYDHTFFGGDYSGVGKFAFIRSDRIYEADNSIERAFELQTGLPRENIIHYCEDDIYDQYDDEIGHNQKEQN